MIIRRVKSTVVVTVLRCKGLKDMDTFGNNDVFVRVRINNRDSLQQQTPTLFDTGSTAIWGDGKGHNLIFEDAPQLEKVEFFAYDVDGEEGNEDSNELIGKGKVPSIIVELDCNYSRTMTAAAQAEVDQLARQMHEMEAQKHIKDQQWESLRRDEFGEGDWHWHSAPMLSLREEIGERKYEEDEELFGGIAGKATERLGKLSKVLDDKVEEVGKHVKAKTKHNKHGKTRHGKKSSRGQPGAEEANPLHSDGNHGAESARSHDFDHTDPADEFANPMADGLPVGSQADAQAPSTSVPATPKRRKKKTGLMRKKHQQSGPMETEFAPADFESNPLADATDVLENDRLGMGDMDVENPRKQEQQVPEETQAPPTPPSTKKKRKKKTKKDLNFAEVENPMTMGDDEQEEEV